MVSSFLQRSALILLPAAAIVSCTGDRVAPPEDIAVNTPRSSRSYRQLEGRVEDIDAGREFLGPVGSPAAYAPEPARGNGGSAAINYLETPNLAGVHNGAADAAEPTAKGGVLLSPEDTAEEAFANPADDTGSASEIPAEGINIDAGLGVAGAAEPGEPQGLSQNLSGDLSPGQPVSSQILVPQGPMAIAEGSTAQPVVDGIGTENPVTLLPNGEQAADGDL